MYSANNADRSKGNGLNLGHRNLMAYPLKVQGQTLPLKIPFKIHVSWLDMASPFRPGRHLRDALRDTSLDHGSINQLSNLQVNSFWTMCLPSLATGHTSKHSTSVLDVKQCYSTSPVAFSTSLRALRVLFNSMSYINLQTIRTDAYPHTLCL